MNTINPIESPLSSTPVAAAGVAPGVDSWSPTDAEIVAFFIETMRFTRNAVGQIMRDVKKSQEDARELAAIKDKLNIAISTATGSTESTDPMVTIPLDVSQKLWDMNLTVGGKPWQWHWARDWNLSVSVPSAQNILAAVEQRRNTAQDMSSEASSSLTKANGDSTVATTFANAAIEEYKSLKKSIAQNF